MDTRQQDKTTQPHQTDAVAKILAAVEQNQQRILVMMPMGTGRTGVVMMVVEQLRAWQREVVVVAQSRVEIDRVRSRIRTGINDVHYYTLGELTQPEAQPSSQSSEAVSNRSEPDRRIAGRIVISINASLGKTLRDRTRTAEVLHAASAIIGFTALPTRREIETYGEPVYALGMDEAFERGIVSRPKFLSAPPAPLGEHPDPAQIATIFNALPRDTRVGRCVFVCASLQAGEVFHQALIRQAGSNIRIARVAAEQSAAQRQTACEAQWVIVSPSLMAGVDIADVRHVVLLDNFGLATFLRAVQFSLRPVSQGSATIVDFGGNRAEWEALGQASAMLALIDEEDDTDTAITALKWVRPHADGAATADLLGRENLIHVLMGIIKYKSREHSLAVGLFGRWGSGKSTIINLLKERIGTELDIAVIDFNAWENEHVSSMPAALADAVTRQIHQRHPPLQRFWLMVKQRILVNDTAATLTLLLLVILLVFVVPIEKLDDKLDYHASSPLTERMQVWITAAVSAVLAIQVFWKSAFVQGLRSLVKRIGYAEHIGLARRLRDDLESLFKADAYGLRELLRDLLPTSAVKRPSAAEAKRATYLVVIDDLDRCSRQNVWNVVEATRLIAQSPQVVLMFAVDYRLLFDAVAERLKDSAGQDADRARLSREFLAKILQLSVQLPDPSGDAINKFIKGALFTHMEAPYTEQALTSQADQGSGPANEAQAQLGGESTAAATLTGNGARPDEEPVPLAEDYIASTPAQATIFQECAQAFAIANPRALLRLYNSVILVKGLHAEVAKQADEYRRHTFYIFLTEVFAAHGQGKTDMEARLNELAASPDVGPWRTALDYAHRHNLLGPEQATANRLALQRAWATSLPVLP